MIHWRPAWYAQGKQLTALARDYYGIERKRWLWIFRESDRSLRKRCRAVYVAVAKATSRPH